MEEIREQDESVQEPVTSPEDEQDAGADVEFDPERFKATLSKKNREAESLRKRLKELEPLAEKARELEEGSKSELQRLQEESGSFKRSEERRVGKESRSRWPRYAEKIKKDEARLKRSGRR